MDSQKSRLVYGDILLGFVPYPQPTSFNEEKYNVTTTNYGRNKAYS